MSDPHHHGCHDEHHDHDHDHGLPESVGPRDNLFAKIDIDNVTALNTEGEGRTVIKPWDQRMDEQAFIESDADDQLIIRVPFTGTVKLRALLLKTGPGDQTPASVALFANQDNLDFSDVTDRKPSQSFEVAIGREVGEYSVLRAKFSNVTSITLFFPRSQGADTVQVYYVGFLGQWSERPTDPVPTGVVYESAPALADHQKIQGLDVGGSLGTQ